MPHIDTIVIGGGQAGLAVSHELSASGVEHFVLERGRIGETWRHRWRSFCLVTPNWSVQLPGWPYRGSDPDAFMPRDEIVAHLEAYAQTARLPVREGVTVTALRPAPDRGFVVETTREAGGETWHARRVVLATGAYLRPHRPAAADALPSSLFQMDVSDYDSPGALPPGRVLVIGSGQSGCQIAEELHEAGRDVVLACGRAPWAVRRIGGHDLVWWLVESGFLDAPTASLQSPSARLDANIQATGHGGGHDLHYRTLRTLGVTLTGRLAGARHGRAHFVADLSESVRWGDERQTQIMNLVRKVSDAQGLTPPPINPPAPFDSSAPASIELARLGAVIFAGGFRPDYRWLPWPEAFDDLGFPRQEDGASTVVPGLYFVGGHFLRKRKSSLLVGVGEDATVVARAITAAH
jgi:putative flavoprotein involved in K+ transport